MRILNFGSLNIDNVYRMPHFVRPGETVSSLSLENFPGGKGLNQSVALANAGARVFHAGAVGEDGGCLLSLLEEKGVDVSFVRTLPGRTGHAVIQVDPKGENCILLYGGANRRITGEQISSTLQAFSEGDILLLQNEINDVRLILEEAVQRGMRVALNPSPMDGEALALPLEKVDCFLLNRIEGGQITGRTAPEDILAAMRSRFPKSTVVLTLGSRGVLAADSAGVYRHGIYDVPVVDTTGAGDTFTGYFLACAAGGMGIERSLELASKASSLAVGKKGAASSIPKMEEVLSAQIPEVRKWEEK